MKLRTIITALVAIAFAAAGAYFSADFSEAHAEKSAPSEALYKSKLALVPTGEVQSLEQYRNQVLVVNFWAPWCPPCVKEIPLLTKLDKQLAPKGIKFIGIGADSLKNLTDFPRRNMMTYPTYVADGDGALYQALGIKNAIPYTLLINKSGEIVKRYEGEIHDIEQFRADILAVK